MKKLFIITIFFALYFQGKAQSPIVLEDGENIFIHSRLDTIINRAKDGNTIYLPGGNVNLNQNLIINKEVHIIGAGHYPDSSSATSVTFISGANIYFTTGSSRSSITGVYLYNNLIFASTSNDSVHFMNVTRCNLNTVYLGYSSSKRNSLSTNFVFSENVIRGRVSGADVQYCLFEKNIFDGQITYFTGNCTFRNNIFTYYYGSSDVFNNVTGINLNNNIFTRDRHGLTGSQINNNIFSVNMDPEPGGTNLGSGNIGNQAMEDVFVDFDGVAFDYAADLHLEEGSPGISGGTDGTDIGIYGTVSPYKPSAVPHNPHIRRVDIATETDNGQLQIEIEVGAQDN